MNTDIIGLLRNVNSIYICYTSVNIKYIVNKIIGKFVAKNKTPKSSFILSPLNLSDVG